MILRNFDELIGVAKVRGCRRIAVARADDETVLEGLKLAWDEDVVEPILFGDRERIRAMMGDLGIAADWRIDHVDGDDRTCAEAAVAAVRRGEAELLMKGQISTGALFGAVLSRDKGLPRGGVLSHIAFIEIEQYHKLFGFTDGGLNLHPGFEQKVAIVRNVIGAFHSLGYRRPKVALLSYIEKVNEGDDETEEWARITEMARRGELGEAIVEGPMAMDLCLSAEAKRIKGFASEVAADPDAIVAPNITACNASAKALLLEGGIAGGVVVGSTAPIIALSRGDSPRTRLCSLAVASALFRDEAAKV